MATKSFWCGWRLFSCISRGQLLTTSLVYSNKYQECLCAVWVVSQYLHLSKFVNYYYILRQLNSAVSGRAFFNPLTMGDKISRLVFFWGDAVLGDWAYSLWLVRPRILRR
ncbi:uncharacterized protein LOC122262542 [Penaeus japonicus]|uniref:uncharacterized protein LOC122262542 n=1 Tax=Penaeus japonicus TaxID=27405 RepID=UPI001C712D1B|nr:uncharacterized protein LOC122262542 [Penaeus japonicus]